MKKIFLFLVSALLSLVVGAAEYNVVISDANLFPKLEDGGDINITSQLNLGENLLKEGDVVNVTIKGYFSVAVDDILYVGIVDNSEAAGYWTTLSEMNYSGTSMGGGAVAFESECNVTVPIQIVKDAVTSEKIIIRTMLTLSSAVKRKLGDAPVKLRATLSELTAVAAQYDVEMPTGEFQLDGVSETQTQFKMEVEFDVPEVIKKDDIINLKISGTFSADIYHSTVMVFEEANEVLPWTPITFTATKDNEITDVVIQITMPNSFSGKTGKVMLFAIYQSGEEAPEGISFLKAGEEVHEGIELGPKSYETVSLDYNQYATPHNYQFIDAAIATNVLPNDYVTFSITGVTNKAFEGTLRVYLREGVEGGSYGAISAYTTIAEKVDAQGEISFEATLKATKAADICDLVMEISDEAEEGASIVIAPAGTQVHEGVELTSKEFTTLTLAANVWDDGSNYQYEEEVTAPADGFLKGDYVSLSINGVASNDIAKLQVALIGSEYNNVSDYVTIAENVKAGETIAFTKKIVLNGATDVCKLTITTTDPAVEDVAEIKIEPKENNVAVDEVSASVFAVEGGMVYSAGEIVVYNVAGKPVASASKAFNVNSLAAGVYFITAQEGTIKFVK
jgi:hypothetical protein